MTTAGAGPSVNTRVLALLWRPFCIFFGTTFFGYLLFGLADRWRQSDLTATLGSYSSWLAEFPSSRVLEADNVEGTLQLLVAGSVVALVLGTGFGLVMRAGSLGRLLAALSLPTISIAGPGFALFLLYWLGLRADLFSVGGFESIAEDPLGALGKLVLPSLAVGIPLAPTVAAMVAQRDRFTEPFGLAAVDAMLASRSEERERWRFGFPAGALITAMLSAELVFSRPGLGAAFILNIVRLESRPALDVIGIIALGGAALALAVDMLGLRPHTSTRPTAAGIRLAGYSAKPPSMVLLAAIFGLAGVVVVAAVAGRFGDPEAITDFRGGLAPPFTDGHLLGTDKVGRDVLSSTLAALGRDLTAALIPSLGATLAGVILAAIHTRLGAISHLVPGAPIDIFWGPLPLFVILAALAFGDGLNLAHPGVLAVVVLIVIPTASRFIRREPISFDAGGLLRIAGVWLLLGGLVLGAESVASYAGFGGRVGQSLGVNIRGGLVDLDVSTWPSAVPAVALAIALLSLNSSGAALVHLGRHRSTQRLLTTLDDGQPNAPIHLAPMQPQRPAQNEATQHEPTLPTFPAIDVSRFRPPD